MSTIASGATPTVVYPEGRSRWFWPALVIGGLIMAVGVRGLVVNRAAVMATNPSGWIRVWLGANVIHDLVVVPVVLAVGLAVRRIVPAQVRAAVQGGLVATAIVVLYALPLVLRLGSTGGNETILPRDYERGLLILVALVWLVAGAVGVVSGRRDRRQRAGLAPRPGRGRVT